MKKRLTGMLMTLAVTISMLAGSAAAVWADAPTLDKIEYKGNGKVEVEFREKVRYKRCSVSVKDSSGKSYSIKNLDKDDDDLDFVIKAFKKGTTYTVTVSGVRERGTSGYGSVSGKVTIPAETSSSISKSKAIEIAKSHAKSKWNAKSFRDVDVEKDTFRGSPVWEVDFDAKSGGKTYEYEYKIRRSDGKILKYERDRD